MADRIGQRLGNYQLLRKLGDGGFAEVYLGEHIHLGTQAAIKVLHTQLTSDDVETFRTEARTIARLVHPHIVRVLEFGIEDKTPFLVMDHAPNGTLRQRHPKGSALPHALIVAYIKQLADALQYAHDEKVIHRDVKPENMLIGRRDEILLSDFGIALVAQSSRYQSDQGMAGTIPYMAPEQLQGKPRSASDQYALGIVTYEWLCGERPFKGTFVEIASQHLLGSPPPLCEKVPDLSPAVEAVVFKALAKTPEARYARVQEFADALIDALQTTPMSVLDGASALSSHLPDASDSVGQIDLSLTIPPQEEVQSSVDEQSVDSQEDIPTERRQPLSDNSKQELPKSPTDEQNDKIQPAMTQPVSLVSPQTDVAESATLIATMPADIPENGMLVTLPPDDMGESVFASSLGEDLEPGDKKIVQPQSKPVPINRRRKRVVASALSILLLIGSVLAYFVQPALASMIFPAPYAKSAHVTVTMDSQMLQKQYTVHAVTGIPDTSRYQVQTRDIVVTPPSQSKTVNASKTYLDATYAHGTVSVFGNDNFPANGTQTFYAGQVITNNPAGSNRTGEGLTDSQGRLRAIRLDTSVTITATSYATVSATYAYIGAAGNIGADGTAGSYGFFSDSSITLNTQYDVLFTMDTYHPPFTGGRDAGYYPFVQQSDIDSATSGISAPDARKVISSQLRPNERLSGTPTCKMQTSADKAVGDQADTVTVTATFTCSGKAYDYNGALDAASRQLKDQASKDLGKEYTLSGTVSTTQQSATPNADGTVSIVVATSGTWAFQVSSAQKEAWQRALKGKQKGEAEAFLHRQKGVKQVLIVLSGGNPNVLPDDARNIAVIVQPSTGP